MRKGGIGFFIVYLVFALYFINYPIRFVKIPESFLSFEPWIIFIGGLLILLGAFNYYRAKRVLNPAF